MNAQPHFATHFEEGIRHFNAGEFWDAHESWETIWRAAQSADVRRFLQGLIQIAAAYHHVKRGTFPGAVRLFDAGLEKLEGISQTWCGIDRSAMTFAARRHRQWIASLLERKATQERLAAGEYPLLLMLHDEHCPMPPCQYW